MKKFRIARAARSPKPNPMPKGRVLVGEHPSQPAQVAKQEIPVGRRLVRPGVKMLGAILVIAAMCLYLLPLASTPQGLFADYGSQILQTTPHDQNGVKQFPASGIFPVNWLVSIRYIVSPINAQDGEFVSMYPYQVDDIPEHLRWSINSHFEAERFAVVAIIALVAIGSVAFFLAN